MLGSSELASAVGSPQVVVSGSGGPPVSAGAEDSPSEDAPVSVAGVSVAVSAEPPASASAVSAEPLVGDGSVLSGSPPVAPSAGATPSVWGSSDSMALCVAGDPESPSVGVGGAASIASSPLGVVPGTEVWPADDSSMAVASGWIDAVPSAAGASTSVPGAAGSVAAGSGVASDVGSAATGSSASVAADVGGVVWSGAVWSGAVWPGAVWSGAVWSGAVWSGAVGDD